jgi:hypothetical protein
MTKRTKIVSGQVRRNGIRKDSKEGRLFLMKQQQQREEQFKREREYAYFCSLDDMNKLFYLLR